MAYLNSAPIHGGNLTNAMNTYGGTRTQWLDCSTGISPWSYPLPPVPLSVWHDLPDQDKDLLRVASQYYRCSEDYLLAVSGSQSAISLLPRCRSKLSRVGIIAPSYAEHQWQWQQQGHTIQQLQPHEIDSSLAQLDVLIIINPNNPTGKYYSTEQLRVWQQQLAQRDGWLIVDEAFMDHAPDHSMMPYAGTDGLIILRSLGKFFGLAGMRLGFVACQAALKVQLYQYCSPWSVNGLAQWAGQLALADTAWYSLQQQRLMNAQSTFTELLATVGLSVQSKHPLLYWCPTPDAQRWHLALAQQQVLCRYFENASSLRFGTLLPEDYDRFTQRLHIAYESLTP